MRPSELARYVASTYFCASTSDRHDLARESRAYSAIHRQALQIVTTVRLEDNCIRPQISCPTSPDRAICGGATSPTLLILTSTRSDTTFTLRPLQRQRSCRSVKYGGSYRKKFDAELHAPVVCRVLRCARPPHLHLPRTCIMHRSAAPSMQHLGVHPRSTFAIASHITTNCRRAHQRLRRGNAWPARQPIATSFATTPCGGTHLLHLVILPLSNPVHCLPS